jgi:hypothetical protein
MFAAAKTFVQRFRKLWQSTEFVPVGFLKTSSSDFFVALETWSRSFASSEFILRNRTLPVLVDFLTRS